jgi:hypothetical protein
MNTEKLIDRILEADLKAFRRNGNRLPEPKPKLEAETKIEDGPELLRNVTDFIGRYLQCSRHQRTVLALWVLHTYCFSEAQVTPYLAILSPQKQAGKTLCLHLLSMLCQNPILTSGLTPARLRHSMEGNAQSLLLDEFPASVGTQTRSRALALRALLATSFYHSPGCLDADAALERKCFCPKAFAGTGQLPEDLRDLSLPIVLQPLQREAGLWRSPDLVCPPEEPKNEAEPQNPDQELKNLDQESKNKNKVERFHQARAAEEAKALRRRLDLWARQNASKLRDLPPCPEENFPNFLLRLSPRRQDMLEPLLQLAGLIGADWPARLQKAVELILEEGEKFQLHPNLQLLQDIFDCFAYHNFPDRLSSAQLLEWSYSRPPRPWDADGPMTQYKLARLLVPFEIRPRLQRIGEAAPARGYPIQQFLQPWKQYFNLRVPGHTPGCELRYPQLPSWYLDRDPKRTPKPNTETETAGSACPSEPQAEPRIPNNDEAWNGSQQDVQKAAQTDGQDKDRVAPAPPPVSACPESPSRPSRLPENNLENGSDQIAPIRNRRSRLPRRAAR